MCVLQLDEAGRRILRLKDEIQALKAENAALRTSDRGSAESAAGPSGTELQLQEDVQGLRATIGALVPENSRLVEENVR